MSSTIWAYKFRKQRNVKPSPLLLWYRFPKFILGYLAASIILSLVVLNYPSIQAGSEAVDTVIKSGTEPIRVAFFTFTFLAIGLSTQFSRFKEIKLRRPVLAYGLSLLFAIVWGAIISYFLFAR